MLDSSLLPRLFQVSSHSQTLERDDLELTTYELNALMIVKQPAIMHYNNLLPPAISTDVEPGASFISVYFLQEKLGTCPNFSNV